MSNSKRMNKKNKNVRKNYKIEALEPRFMMDAASDASYDQWVAELSDISMPSYWKNDADDQKWIEDDSINAIVDGLYRKNEDDGTLKCAQLSDLLEYDISANYGLGLDVTDKVLEKVKSDLSSKMKGISKNSVITASNLKNAIESGKKSDNGKMYDLTYSSKYYIDTINYDVRSVTNGAITIAVTIDTDSIFHEDDSWIAEYLADKQNDQVMDYTNKFFSADVSGTTIGIESDFDCNSYKKSLEFTFVLDGNVKTSLDLNASVSFDLTFDKAEEAKFGVLELTSVSDESESPDLEIKHKWTISSDGKQDNKTGFAANLAYKIKDVDSTFHGQDVVRDSFKYTKSLSFDEDSKGKWSNSKIDNYGKFTMGKVLGKLQEVYSRLNAIQNGEFYNNNVDFGALLSKNANSLLDLSKMLEEIINNPPNSLQELVQQTKNSFYKLTNAGELRIDVSKNSILIPFKFEYAELNDKDKRITDIESKVALSKEGLESILHAEVLENKNVKVESSATLVFNLIIPFVDSERAVYDSKLYEMGLDKTNDQFGTVIGAKALVADKMDRYYGSKDSFSDYVKYIVSECGKFGEVVEGCLNTGNERYALYYDLDSSIANLGLSVEDVDWKFNPKTIAEFNGSVANKCVVIKWNDEYKQINYEKYSSRSKDRDIVGNSPEERVNSAVSTLNALFAQSDIEALKDLKAIAFDDCIVILLGAKKVEAKKGEKASAETEEIKNILAEIKKINFVKADDKKVAIDNLALKEIWISDALTPQHYNEKAAMTVTVGNTSYDFEFTAGYFNSATCVADIAASIQEKINAKFRWNIENKAKKIDYEPVHLFVDSFDGRIRFVSLQDFVIDFHDEAFAKWLGFETSAFFVDAMQGDHALIATSAAEVEKMKFNTCKAEGKILFENLKKLDWKISVDGTEQSISVSESDFGGVYWASDVASVLQNKINKAFGWDDATAKLFVACHNDYLCLKSSKNFSVSTSDEGMFTVLGFATTDVKGGGNGSKTFILYNVKEYRSIKLNANNISAIQGYGSDIELTVSIDKDHQYTVKCKASDFKSTSTNGAMSLEDVAYTLNGLVQEACTDYTLPAVYVSAVDGSICFHSQADFSISFNSEDTAKLFGFGKLDGKASGKVLGLHEVKKFVDNVKPECMEIGVKFGDKGESTNYSIDISSIIDDYQESGIKECKVGVLLEKIVAVLNSKIGHDYFVVKTREVGSYEKVGIFVDEEACKDLKVQPLISYIHDINGYTIATLLGLVGEYGANTESQRADFYVEASLVDDYIVDDAKVPLFSNFNLGITNKIIDGKAVVPLLDGVIGEKAYINMTGAQCTTTVTKYNPARIKALHEPVYNYVSVPNPLKREGVVLVDKGLGKNNQQNQLTSGEILYGLFVKNEKGEYVLKEDATSSNHVGAQFARETDYVIFNNPNNAFHDYTKGDLYADLYAASMYWIEELFGANAYGWANAQFPVLGETILEIMGLQPKLAELENLLKTDMSCNTIQELVAYITEKTGIKTTATVRNGNSIVLNFVWSTTIKNKRIELDHLSFNHDTFGLSGLFKTFLNANLTFSAQVVLEENGATHQVVGNPSKPSITGTVDFVAKNISADMVVYSIENDVRKETELQVESATGKESNIFFHADAKKDQIDMYLGGLLYVYNYGAPAGTVKISVAQQNRYEGNSSWNGQKEDRSGYLLCKSETPRAVVVWKNNGSVAPDKDIQKGDILLDFTAVENIELKQTSLFDKLRQSVDGLSDIVRRLQSNLNTAVLNENIRNIPLIGDSIINVGDSLSFLNDRFVEPFRNYVYKKTEGLNAGVVANKLYTILGEYILPNAEGGLEICNDAAPAYWAQQKFTRYYKGIQFFESDEEVYWHLRLHTTYTLEKDADFDLGFPGLGLKGDAGVDIELDLEFDFGFGFSLKDGAFLLLSNGHENPEEAKNTFKTEWPDSKDTSSGMQKYKHAGDDLTMVIKVKPKAVLEGSLGFLAMNASLTKNDIILSLGLDLNDGGGYNEKALEDWNSDKKAKSRIKFRELVSNISPDANLRGVVDLEIPMMLGIGGYGEKAPHIDAQFSVKWQSEFGDGFGHLERVAFDKIVFDCGSFVQGTVGGLIQKVNRVIEPIRPLIKFLQSEIPVLNKLPAGKVKMTVLDLIKKFGEQKGMDFGFLDDIIEMDNVMKMLENVLNKGYMIDKWVIYERPAEQASDGGKPQQAPSNRGELRAPAAPAEGGNKGNDSAQNEAGLSFLNGSVTDVDKFLSESINLDSLTSGWVDRGKNLLSPLSSDGLGLGKAIDYAKDYVNEKVEVVKKAAEEWPGTHTSIQTPEFGGNWEFPIFETPKEEVMKLLLGGNTNLVVFDMRPLKFNFDWRKSFPIIGPLCADVGFSFGVDIDLCFGYDTYGIARWAESNYENYGALIDGFFVADWDLKTGEDVAEVVFHSGVVAGASLCGRFGVNVGLNLNVNLDFKDPNDDGKIRLGEMAEMLSLNPLDTFDVSASISARAYAYLDVVFYRKEWTLWSSGAFELFNTASGSKVNLATHSDENLIVNVGEYAKENGIKGANEDGDEEVEVKISNSTTVEIILKRDGVEKGRRTYKKISENNVCIYAGEGADKVTVSSDGNANLNVIVYGGNGDDKVDLSGLSLEKGCMAVVCGSAGSDYINGAASGANYLFGDEGYCLYTPETQKKKNKTVASVFAYPTDISSGAADIIVASEKAEPTNVIFGGAGNDFIVGGGAQSIIFGDYGRLQLDGRGNYVADRHDTFDQGGDDLIYGGENNDRIYGGAGGDMINANGGNDEVYGGQGNDVIYGGSGDDTIYGGDGTDVIFGDKPFDEYMTIARSDNANGAQLPYTLVPHDLKGMVDADGKYISPFFSVVDENGTKVDTVKTFDFDFKYSRKNSAELSKWLTFMSSTANGLILKNLSRAEESVTNGSDVIDGGNGADVIFGDDGKNAVDAGKETLTGGRDDIKGGAGNDFIDGDAGADRIDGGSGMDIIYGGRGGDTLDGGSGMDFVFGDDGWADYENKGSGQWFGKNGVVANGKPVFGEVANVAGKVFGISNEAKSRQGGGDDTIVAGNDSDFIDGQGGNDTYKVQFMGGTQEVVTNVMDSGDDKDDKLNVIGTLEGDDIVVNASDAGLGLIARSLGAYSKSKYERVNYWKSGTNGGVESASVETRAGSDTINVNGTLTAMDINAGTDNDSVNIGVMDYGKPSQYADMNSLDVYDKSVIETPVGFLSEGTRHALSVSGGAGDDTITVNHTNAALSLYGDLGDDTFNVKSYVDVKKNPILNHGQISVIGGDRWPGSASVSGEATNGTLNIYGLPVSSKYMVAPHHILTTNLDVTFAAIRNMNLTGSMEQDAFYCYECPSIAQHINANGGDDLIYNSNLKNFGEQEYLMRLPSGATKAAVADAIKKDSQKLEKGTQVLLTDSKGNLLSDIPYLDASSGSTRYGVVLSEAPKSGEVVVRVMVPNVSSDDLQRNVQSITLNGKNYVDLTFNAKNYNKPQYIDVEALKDEISGTVISCIRHDIIKSNETVIPECPSVLVWTEGSSIYVNTEQFAFKDTINCKISDCQYDKKSKVYSLKVKVNPGTTITEALSKVFVLSVNGKNIDPSSINLKDGYLNISWKGNKINADDEVRIAYKSSTWYLEGESSVPLNYLDSALYTNHGTYAGSGLLPVFLLNVNGKVYSVSNTRDESADGFFYIVDGSRAIICSNETGEVTSVNGSISIDSTKHTTVDVSTGMAYSFLSHTENANGAEWTYSGYEDIHMAIQEQEPNNNRYSIKSSSSDNGEPFRIKVDVPEGQKTAKIKITVNEQSYVPEITWLWTDANGVQQSGVTSSNQRPDGTWDHDTPIEIELTAQCELGSTYIYMCPETGLNTTVYVDVI